MCAIRLKLLPVAVFLATAVLVACSGSLSETTPAPAPAASGTDRTPIPASGAAATSSSTAVATTVPTPSRDLSIQELLRASNAAMQSARSAHLVYEAATDVENRVSLFVGIEGDYQAPDHFRYSMTTGFGPGSGAFTSKYTLIGSRAFLKDPKSGVWKPDPASQIPFVFSPILRQLHGE